MYMLIPRSNSVVDVNKKFYVFFNDEVTLCNQSRRDLACLPQWWSFMCVSLSEQNASAVITECPYYHAVVHSGCHGNGTWNVTAELLFELCYGHDFLTRAAVINHIFLFMNPFLLLLFTTTVFKLHQFQEVSREYHWKVIIWVLLFKCFSLLVRLMNAVLNSAYLIYYFCMLYLVICLYSDFFAISCMFTECVYIYAIIYYSSTQLRIIKAALKHIAFMSPIILLVIGLIIDVSFDDRRMFRCLEEPLLSPISFLYVYLSIGTAISMAFMRIRIKKYLIAANVYQVSINAFRIEYDILGRRKEISHRDIIRMLFVTDVIIITAAINILINSFTLFARFAPIRTFYSEFSMYAYPCNDLIFSFLALRAVWFNPTLKTLVKALKRWYKDIDKYTIIDNKISKELFSSTPFASKETSQESNDGKLKWP